MRLQSEINRMSIEHYVVLTGAFFKEDFELAESALGVPRLAQPEYRVALYLLYGCRDDPHVSQ